MVARDLAGIDAHIREGRFQRSLSLMAGLSSILAGVEVAYEHGCGKASLKAASILLNETGMG